MLRAKVTASGDRLLISLLVKAREKKSWFGFGTEATVHVWGKPVLDREQQILRMSEISLAVESEAAFGLLGAAARAAMPYLQAALQKNAVVDLKPFAANARTASRRRSPSSASRARTCRSRPPSPDFGSPTSRSIPARCA